MKCKYCKENNGAINFLPKKMENLNAYVTNYDKQDVCLNIVDSDGIQGIFPIKYCPMCGKRLFE